MTNSSRSLDFFFFFFLNSNPTKQEVIVFEAHNAHLQMSVISVGTGSSLVSLGIMAKPPRAYRKPPMEIKLRELRSCGNPVNSDHLEQNVTVNTQPSADGV